MYTVYVIQSSTTGKLYIGYTSDIAKRILQHNEENSHNKRGYTHKNKGPWKIVYSEEYERVDVARRREKELKSYRGREYIKNTLVL